MDLDHLQSQHRAALARAAEAGVRAGGYDMVGHYRARIERARRNFGLPSLPEWCRIPASIGPVGTFS
ncbi:hypothetical protein [Novosphingobium cyanobacteriorum]|uniref:Uncharacterized protein n=1 Tax=Novosphingobium cyanobacteriorum TaxID=3024215 RepID=A0ABT6CHG7_9SPHN|nr:hypothetical protein [Novosphingobium cyanobacteriorum]MDF8333369.1 hypothetical protein [Novosphingobium cyanobacteriorum]